MGGHSMRRGEKSIKVRDQRGSLRCYVVSCPDVDLVFRRARDNQYAPG